jgi:GDP-L-fucose synthase
MHFEDKIFITNSNEFIGCAIQMMLHKKGYKNTISNNFDLCDETEVDSFFNREKPDYVFFAAGLFGGILANLKYPADFFLNNIKSETNVIHSAYKYGVNKLLYLASSCCYPKNCAQPIKEEYLMSGRMEQTSEPYSMAKASGIIMCDAYNHQHNTFFIPAIPSNIYGPGDDFSPVNSHVLSALIARMHHAKISKENYVTLWGSGKPLREFLFVDDLADICIALMNNYDENALINIAGGNEISILELAEKISSIVGFKGKIIFDPSKPDGTYRKKLDGSRLLNFGLNVCRPLDEGLMLTYKWYKEHINK